MAPIYSSNDFRQQKTKFQVQVQQKIVIQTPENGKQFTPIQPHKIKFVAEHNKVQQSKWSLAR